MDPSARHILNKFILNLINKSKLIGAEECLRCCEAAERDGRPGRQAAKSVSRLW
jgi:hypothetical protein